MKKTIMGHVSLSDYADGQVALARIETLKAFTIKSDYSITREEIASILGFELPDKESGHEEVS
jgi:hypothetical protein